jgi:hypothetical protein
MTFGNANVQGLDNSLIGRRKGSDNLLQRVSYDAVRRIMMRKRLTRRVAGWLAVGGLTFAMAARIAAASAPPDAAASSMPKVGEMAPDFALNYFDGNDLKKISLSEYRGRKNVVVAFFIFAFTGG